MEKLSIFYTFLCLSHRAKNFYFSDSSSDLELNKPYFVAATIAEKTPLLNSKVWT